MGPLLPRTRVRPRPMRTAPGRPRPRAQPRLLHPGRSRSPGLVLGPWRGHRNRTLDRSTGTGTWTGTSCPTPVSGTPGQQLVFGCPRRFHPRATRTFLGSSFLLFPPLLFLFSCRLRAACPPFVFFSFGLSLC
ncbi:hypothetical protein MTO96_050031 [Rhipicephalus appendiculatus]